jgi:hypothetical protein
MESFGADINDHSRKLPGGKLLILIDGYQLPLDFKNGLPYLHCQKPKENELRSLPHIIMTADVEWDPILYNNGINDIKKLHDTSVDDNENEHFNQYGEYWNRTVATLTVLPEEEFFDCIKYIEFEYQVDDVMDTIYPKSVCDIYDINLTDVIKLKPNFELLHPLFGWAPADTSKKTFDVTIHFARGRVSDTLKHHWRSCLPACNVP